MIENSETLLPIRFGQTLPVRAFTLGVDESSLDEMDRLLDTLGVQVLKRVSAPIRKVVAGTYFGTGKLEEIRLMGAAITDTTQEQVHEVDLFVVDVELSPRQMQNIEKILGKPVLDRAGIILEIFSRHARTHEAKTQVELAKLQYVLPRLAHLWTHFERQRGGGVGNKGMGETQIEVDRRLVKRRMSVLRDRLKIIEKERKVQRSSRGNLLKVALVGYTNAGKSTLLNRLTESTVLAEDKLFATLDATIRALNPDSHPPIVAIDTVGFIQRIPTSLIASFRSTLEEISEADLIVHVVDASSEEAKIQFETTCDVLKELKCDDKEKIVVLNKADLLKTPAQVNAARTVVPGAIRLSALDPVAVAKLREQILEFFRTKMETWELVVPYSEGKFQSQLQEYGSILQERYLEKGIFYQVKLENTLAQKLGVSGMRLRSNLMVGLFFLIFAHPSMAFRTPAHIFGERFAVKVLLKQGVGQYVTTFWLDPKAPDSLIDENQMRDMGWMGESRFWAEVSVSLNPLPIQKFKNAKTETAYLPDYAQSCCVGTLGFDILKNYDLRLVEAETAYVEWTPLTDVEKKDPKKLGKMTYEWIKPTWSLPKKALFDFHFLPPDRKVILSHNWSAPSGEKTVSEKIDAGSEWISINGKKPDRLDRPILERYLKGRITQNLVLEFKSKNKTVQNIKYSF